MLSGKADWRIMRSVYPNQVDVKETSTDGDPKRAHSSFKSSALRSKAVDVRLGQQRTLEAARDLPSKVRRFPDTIGLFIILT
jgi:hypothetical protein